MNPKINKPKALVLASVASMIEHFNMENINILLNLGYDVEVAANFINIGATTSEGVKNLKKKLKLLNIIVHHVPFSRNISNIDEIIYSYKIIKKLCETKHYKIIHCHSPVGGVIARMAAKASRKHGTKVIYTAHGFHFYDGAPKINWLLFYPIEKYCARFTDVLITINKEDYNRAKKNFHAKKTIYVPGVGINTKKYNSGLIDIETLRHKIGVASDEIMILSVGELSVRKNHEIIIRVLKKLNNPQIKYFIVGQGELENYLKKLIQELHLDNKVSLLGYRNNVAELYQAADLFVFPSHQEGLPVALMEAIACKTFVICSNIRGNNDLIQNYKSMFNESNLNDVEKCLKNAIGNRTRQEFLDFAQKEIIQNYKHLKAFDLTVVEKDMKLLYETLGGGKLTKLALQQKFKKELGIPLNSSLIFSVGELNNNKNHSIVIKALAMLENNSIHYIIAGSGKNKDNLINLSEILGIAKQVHLLGYRNDVFELFKFMDIFCLPSLREGLNVSLMEAMASGLPCIVSQIRGNTDLIVNEKGGYVVKPYDIIGYKNSIEKIIKSTKNMGIINTQTIENFSTVVVNNAMKDIYQE